MRIIDDITSFIFVDDTPVPADIIIIPGGSNPELTERAANERIEGGTMILNIGKHPAQVIERGVYYYSPQDYPRVSAYDLKDIVEFVTYEWANGRSTEIICADNELLEKVYDCIANPEAFLNMTLPEKFDAPGCSCAHNACFTEFVYHATDLPSAKQILSSGMLLSAVKAYGKTGEEIAAERSDTPWNDPDDFFEYIMFGWGNCVLGDRVTITDNPEGEQDEEHFRQGKGAGIRFYFRYEDLLNHPGATFDGYHCIKIKDEINLQELLYACVVPEHYRSILEPFIPPELEPKAHFLPQIGLGFAEWSARVYDLCKGDNI